MKFVFYSIIVVIAFFTGAYFFLNGAPSFTTDIGSPANNVSIADGIQVVEIKTKGGYQPRYGAAKAGIPTIIRFNTSGTFDCSSSVRIPSLNISKNLQVSGITDIDIGSPSAGKLQIMCSMGMYRLEIDFQS